jgi:glycosyltransferase involved in cell wall biosynthesis
MHKLKNKKIAIIVSSPMTAFVFLYHKIQCLSKNNDVTLIANFYCSPDFIDSFPNVTIKDIKIPRNIDIVSDVAALWDIFKFLRSERFDLVHSVSPKAGLLTILAAIFARVKVRIHTFTGQVWATKTGLPRFFLKLLDRLIVKCSTAILVDSASQKNFLLKEGVVSSNKASVLASGSISGVDLERFSRSDINRQRIRSELKISNEDVLLIFLGRLKVEKGVLDLAAAFCLAAEKNAHLWLLFVGPDEEDLEAEIKSNVSVVEDRVTFVPFTSKPEDYMSAADIFCLPSYREGFGSVIIEAAASGLPAIASNIYGLTDAVDDGVTGILVEPKNIKALANAINDLSTNHILRSSLALAAKERARSCFSHKLLTQSLLDFYAEQFI